MLILDRGINLEAHFYDCLQVLLLLVIIRLNKHCYTCHNYRYNYNCAMVKLIILYFTLTKSALL